MYQYETERPALFTEGGQVMFLQIRDHVKRLLEKAGAARMLEAMRPATGSTWTMMACVDRLVELGELIEITTPGTMGQHRVFTARFRG